MSSNTKVIAATSDIHGMLDGLEAELKALPRVDYLVIAGDIHPCLIHINTTNWFEHVFFPFVEQLGIPVVATPGNHDFYLNDYLSNSLPNGSKKLPSNFHLLVDKMEQIDGLTFYGTPWVSWINGKWCFEASSAAQKYLFSTIPYGVDVLISHTPPLIKHEHIDISIERPKDYWRHFGSKELTEAIKLKKPRYCFCGHIHSGDHKELVLSHEDGTETKMYNVSRVSEKYTVTYDMTVVNV